MTDRGTFLTWYGTVGAANADLAVIARREGRRMLALGPLTRRYNPCANRLPESAFDWPVYRAALPFAYADLKRREVEALHRYGYRKFGDEWFPGQTRAGYPADDIAVLDEMGYFDAD